MLPILRIVSVGGVFLAITILLLALIPPGGTHSVTSQREVGARGPLMDPVQHPEWRQFRIQAAFLRADELERLRRLPDVVIRAPELEAYAAEKLDRALDEALGKTDAQPAGPVFAGLPADAEPEDVTGSISDNPGATLPIDIGATSSSELPVITNEELPPVVRLPALQLPVLEVPETENLPLPAARPAGAGSTALKPETPRRAVQQRQRRRAVAPIAAATPAPVPPPFNILAAIFESLAAARTTPQTQAQASVQAAAPQPPNRQAVATRAVSQ